ncbi:MAG: beta-propeller fold lactonase family protein, partial [Cyanobacteria bacterium REEB67]|nr:beta-propeller fold lactonase family protein [Cyanobacteria bacterium REEB67]
MNIPPTSTKVVNRATIWFLASALALFASSGIATLPAHATRLPAELVTVLKSTLPDVRIRLDGALETTDGQLYLPILPKAVSASKLVRLKETLPVVPDAKQKTDIYLFDNGFTFVRVIKNLNVKTFPSFRALPEKTRASLLTGHLPVDLIVPDGFALPVSYKPVIGDVSVQLLKELAATPVAPMGKLESAIANSKSGRSPDAHKGPGHGFIFVTSPSTGTITLVAEENMKKIAEVPTEGTPGGMALAGDHLYIADQSKNRILILDYKERNFLPPIELPARACPKSVVALPNGKLLYVSESGLGLVAVIEVETSKVLLTTKVPPGPSRMAINPSGDTILILNAPTGQLTFLSTLNQRVISSIPVGANPTSVVVSPDGAFAYVSCRSAGYVAIIDVAARKMLGGLKAGNAPTGLAIDKEGKKLYVALAKDNKIAVFDLNTRAMIKEIVLPSDVDFPGTMCLLPSGEKLVVSSAATENIAIYDVERGDFDERPVIGHGTDET